MSKTTIPTGGITDGTIATGDIADDAVTAAKSTAHITVADHYIVTAAFAGDADPVSSNISRASAADSVFGNIGSAMSVSSGVFTFPSTGIYKVEFIPYFNDTAANNSVRGLIQTTTNNSSYDTRAQNPTNIADIDTYNYGSVYVSVLFDVTNTSTHKVRFNMYSGYGGFDINGDTNTNETYATFTRVGGT